MTQNSQINYYLIIFLICLNCIACTNRSLIYKKKPLFRLYYTEEGIASWYGGHFHGRKTASGEIYDMYKYSAAHKYLPLGSYVQVTNLNNKKKLIVKVNDRGPFVKKRILDLSYAAACALDIVEAGTAPVHIEIIRLPKNKYTGSFYIQVGAFKGRENADSLCNKLKNSNLNTHVFLFDKDRMQIFYRVRVGPYNDISLAKKILYKLEEQGFVSSFIVAE